MKLAKILIFSAGAIFLYAMFRQRTISPEGIKLLKDLEGVRTKMYKDKEGNPTIGVGHKIDLVKEKDLLTKTLTFYQVNELLSEDLKKFETVVNDEVKANINQNQYDALVIFAFNNGPEAFKNSTLLKKINADGSREEIEQQFKRWKYITVDGEKVVDPVLVSRREKEIKHYFA